MVTEDAIQATEEEENFVVFPSCKACEPQWWPDLENCHNEAIVALLFEVNNYFLFGSNADSTEENLCQKPNLSGQPWTYAFISKAKWTQ